MTSNADTARGTYEQMATEWYYQIMNDVVGPLTSSELAARVRSGQIKEDTLIRKDDSQWVPARQVNGLLESVANHQAQRICPYCGHTVKHPPTICQGCNRKLVLSFNSRLTSAGKQPSRKARADDEPKAESIRERSDRGDVVRYVLLLVAWLCLLLASPYLIYLATTGRLFFQGDLTVVSVVIVAAAVGSIYYLISRVA